MSLQTCARCGGETRTKQVDYLLARYCDHCGSQGWANDMRNGKTIAVDRSGQPFPEPPRTLPSVAACQTGGVLSSLRPSGHNSQEASHA